MLEHTFFGKEKKQKGDILCSSLFPFLSTLLFQTTGFGLIISIT